MVAIKLIQVVGLADEHGRWFQGTEATHEVWRVAGHDKHGNPRATSPGVHGHVQAVERPGHLHVSEQDVEAVRTVQQPCGLVAVPSLHHLEPLVLESLRGHQTNETLVLDE